MGALWLGNVPAWMDETRIVRYLQRTYNMHEPTDVRIKHTDTYGRRQAYCFIDFANEEEANAFQSHGSSLYWPNGKFILVRNARKKKAPHADTPSRRADAVILGQRGHHLGPTRSSSCTGPLRSSSRAVRSSSFLCVSVPRGPYV